MRRVQHPHRRLWPVQRCGEGARPISTAIGAPIVVKADGLAAGKGVVVAMTRDEALAAIDDCFAGKFGAAGAEWWSRNSSTARKSASSACATASTPLPSPAQDHKRVGDGDTGPNTGGMGAYSPARRDDARARRAGDGRDHRADVRGMAERGAPFTGVLFAGLMMTADGPKLIEYNVRFGDPETQVLMMRLKDDLLYCSTPPRDGGLGRRRPAGGTNPR